VPSIAAPGRLHPDAGQAALIALIALIGSPVMSNTAHPHKSPSFLTTLLARYDTAALRPPEPPAGEQLPASENQPEPQAWAELQRWCLHEQARFSVKTLHGPSAPALARRLCLERDGSLQMQATSGAGRVALRLKTKLHDLMPGRPRQPEDAWDSGYVIDTPAGLQALARFQPRRATLVVAQGLKADVLQAATEGLASRQNSLAQPVRLLVLPFVAWCA
jgi:hypothetical protein